LNVTQACVKHRPYPKTHCLQDDGTRSAKILSNLRFLQLIPAALIDLGEKNYFP